MSGDRTRRGKPRFRALLGAALASALLYGSALAGNPPGLSASYLPAVRLNAPQALSYDAFGDSITAGCCSSVAANDYVNVLGSYLGLTANDHGISGSEVYDQQPSIYAYNVTGTPGQLATFMIGTNDATFWGTGNGALPQWSMMEQATLAWLAIPRAYKTVGQSAVASVAISSITSAPYQTTPIAAALATVTTATPHGFATGAGVLIQGATNAAYNIPATVTVTGPTTFTYLVGGTPPTPDGSASITATPAGIAYTSGWSADGTVYGGTMSEVSTTNASKATFQCYGVTCYLAYGLQTGDGGTFTVTVDGTLYGTYLTGGVSNSMKASGVLGANHGSSLARLSGLARGSHTVVVNVTSATSSSNHVWIDWVASPQMVPSAGAPVVIAGGSPIHAAASATAAVGVFVGLVQSAVGTLAGDGLNIGYADVPSYINQYTDLQPDGTHFVDVGHAHIAQAFEAALNTASNPVTKSSFLSAQNSAFPGPIVSGAGYGNLLTGVGPGGNNILGGGYGGANSMTGSGNNNAVVAGSTNSVGGGGTNNTNNNVVAGGSQNVIQFGGNDFLGAGALNSVQGFYNFLGAGQFNQVDGYNSGIVAGTYGADRSRYGWIGAGVGSFTTVVGTAQYGKQGLRGSGSTAAAFRGTADGATAGSANTVNIPAGTHYHTQASATCRDATASGWASWDGAAGDLDRPASGSAGYTGGYSSATAPSRSSGTLTGVTMTLAADTTNNGLSATWTPAGGNTDTIHCLATVDSSQEVQ